MKIKELNRRILRKSIEISRQYLYKLELQKQGSFIMQELMNKPKINVSGGIHISQKLIYKYETNIKKC